MFLLTSCYWLSCLTLTSQDRCGGSITCGDSTLFLFQGQNYGWPNGFRVRWRHRYRHSPQANMVCEGKWKQLVTLKGNRTDRTSPRVTHVRMTGGNRMRMRWSSGISEGKTHLSMEKGHSTYFHQYTPSKQIDRQCETGPSIAPYWDHNIIPPLFG